MGMSCADLDAIRAKIADGQAVRLVNRRNGAQQWFVTLRGKAMRVIMIGERIVTVLEKPGKRRARG